AASTPPWKSSSPTPGARCSPGSAGWRESSAAASAGGSRRRWRARAAPAAPEELWPDAWSSVLAGIGGLEEKLGRSFGGGEQPPLLVSVRSGAAVSMPGMMDTVLNLGITEEVQERLAAPRGAQ